MHRMSSVTTATRRVIMKGRVQGQEYDSNCFKEHMLLAKKDEAGIYLIDAQNDFLLANVPNSKELEELNAICIMMANLQSINNDSDIGPSYDCDFANKVNDSQNESPSNDMNPNDIYNSVDACKTAQAMWQRVKRLMQGTNLSKHERLHDFLMNLASQRDAGESIESYYACFSKIMNDLEHHGCLPQAFASNTKFLSSMQPEWDKYVTMAQLFEFQGDATNDDLTDSLTTPMMLLAKALTQHYSTPTNTRRVVGNSRNVTYGQQSSGNNATMQRVSRTKLEELNAICIMMANLQSINNDSDIGPSYDCDFANEADLKGDGKKWFEADIDAMNAIMLGIRMTFTTHQRDAGESIESYYACFSKIMNDLEHHGCLPQAFASNTKFLSSMQPEWDKVRMLEMLVEMWEKLLGIRGMLYFAQQGNGSNATVQRHPRMSASSGNAHNVQCYNCNEKGHYERVCPNPRVHDSNYFKEQMLLAKKDEDVIDLNIKENDFLLADVHIANEENDYEKSLINDMFAKHDQEQYVEGNSENDTQDNNAHDQTKADFELLVWNVHLEVEKTNKNKPEFKHDYMKAYNKALNREKKLKDQLKTQLLLEKQKLDVLEKEKDELTIKVSRLKDNLSKQTQEQESLIKLKTIQMLGSKSHSPFDPVSKSVLGSVWRDLFAVAGLGHVVVVAAELSFFAGRVSDI
ncbi:gag-pol polyprotein [Tanacetum coccineum]